MALVEIAGSAARGAVLVLGILLWSAIGYGQAVPSMGARSGALSPKAAAAVRTISFAGHTWTVKTGGGSRVGPGPNYFSDSSSNVWADGSAQLHLKITHSGGKWYCAEVISTESFGYGTYSFHLNSPVGSLDQQAVLGLFTWSDDPAYNHREIDIEFSRWGVANNQNAQYVVQPYNVAGNLFRFEQPAGLYLSTHSFQWSAASVVSESLVGVPGDPSQIIAQHTFTQGIPQAGGENAHINLWLYQGRAPASHQDVEVVINWFAWVP